MTVEAGTVDVGVHLDAMADQEAQENWIAQYSDVEKFRDAIDLAISTNEAHRAFHAYATERERFIYDQAAASIAAGKFSDDKNGQREAKAEAAIYFGEHHADKIVPMSGIVDAGIKSEVLHTYSRMMSVLAYLPEKIPATGYQVLADLEKKINDSHIFPSSIRSLVSSHVSRVHGVDPAAEAAKVEVAA